MSIYGTPEEFVNRVVGASNEGKYLHGAKGTRRFPPASVETKPRPVAVELLIFNAWLEGVCACKTGMKFPVETPYIRGSVKARAWVRGFRAWERDAKHRNN